MALQDQRQDAVLKKSCRSVVLLLAICGGGAGLGFLMFPLGARWVLFPSNGSLGVTEVSRALPPSLPLKSSQPEFGTTGSNEQDSPALRLSPPAISPGFPPHVLPGDAYDPERVRARIAAVQRGDLFGDHTTPPGVDSQSSRQDRRAGPSAIAAEGNLVTIHVQHLTAALTLDPVALQKSTAVLAFPPDEMYRLEAPINGAGIMINDQFVPPGGFTIIGTGSVIHLSGATDIHLRPSEPIKAPLGSG